MKEGRPVGAPAIVREETEEVEGRLIQRSEGPDILYAPRQSCIEGHSKEVHLSHHGETPVVKEEGRLRERDPGVVEENRIRLRRREIESPGGSPGPKLTNGILHAPYNRRES